MSVEDSGMRKKRKKNYLSDIRVIIAVIGAIGLVASAIAGGVFAYQTAKLNSNINSTAQAFDRMLTSQSSTQSALDPNATPSYSTGLRIIPTDGRYIVVKFDGNILDPKDIIGVNQTVTVAFRIINNGATPALIRSLVIGARGPGVGCGNSTDEKWSGRDNPFPVASNLVLQPGEEFEYLGGRAFYLPGKYFLEPNVQGPNGDWGGIEPFTCIDVEVK